jgi:uncharacterized membrane protein YhaH (DUF805 family)
MPQDMMAVGMLALIMALVPLTLVVVILVGIWRGVRRAGYSGAWSLLLLIPFVNVIMIWVFAFATWPVEEKGKAGP